VENSKIWSDQLENVVRAWTDAQKTVWEKWFELAKEAPAAAQPGSAAQWGKLTHDAFEAWISSDALTAKEAAERLIASQEACRRSLDLATEAWKAIAAKMESGEDWQSAVTRYIEGLRDELIHSPERLLHSTEKLSELWRLYIAEFLKLAQPWVASWQKAETHFHAAATGNRSALVELSGLYWDSFDQTFGRLIQSPGLGSTRELNDKFAKIFAAWQEWREASTEYYVIMAEAATRVLERALQEIGSIAERGETIQSLRQWAQPFEKVADPVLTEIFASDKFVQAQARVLNAAMAYWLCRREIVEEFLKFGDMPTRSEVDEIHQTLYEQRKEIKALKKVLAESIAVMQKMSVTISDAKNQQAGQSDSDETHLQESPDINKPSSNQDDKVIPKHRQRQRSRSPKR
jgi:class III poly(R)-hydroxyalkanoic acid synthase PhaE subunit